MAKFPYRFMSHVAKIKKFDVHFNVHVDLKPYRDTPYIVIGNHVSRIDYVYLGLPFYPDTLNYVMGYNEIFKSHLNLVLRAMKIIQKKNFVPDLYAIRQMKRVLKLPNITQIWCVRLSIAIIKAKSAAITWKVPGKRWKNFKKRTIWK